MQTLSEVSQRLINFSTIIIKFLNFSWCVSVISTLFKRFFVFQLKFIVATMTSSFLSLSFKYILHRRFDVSCLCFNNVVFSLFFMIIFDEFIHNVAMYDWLRTAFIFFNRCCIYCFFVCNKIMRNFNFLFLFNIRFF